MPGLYSNSIHAMVTMAIVALLCHTGIWEDAAYLVLHGAACNYFYFLVSDLWAIYHTINLHNVKCASQPVKETGQFYAF